MTRAEASPCERTDVREAHVPRARTATERAGRVPADLAAATVRGRLAAFLDELTLVPETPQLAVLRDRAEALDHAVVARDRGEIDTRWARLRDALARFCLPGTAGHDADLAALAPAVAAVR